MNGIQLVTHHQHQIAIVDKNISNVATDEIKDNQLSDRENNTQNMLTELNLGNAMNNFNANDKYEISCRLLYSFVFVILSSIFILANYLLPVPTLWNVVISSSILLICLVIVIYASACFCQKPCEKVNQLLGIKRSNDINIYEFEQKHFIGLCCLMTIIYSSSTSIVRAVYLWTRTWVDITVHTHVLALLMSISLCVFLFTMKTECNEYINKRKDNILEKYEKARQIEDKINQRLQDWVKSKRFEARRLEWFVTFVIILGYNCTTIVSWWGSIVNNDPLEATITTFIFIIDSIVWSLVVYWYHTFILHYKFPSIIMNELAVSIQSKTIEDLLGWWQLRKFYSNCIVQNYTAAFRKIIFALLTICVALAVFCFQKIIRDGNIYFDSVQLAAWCCYFISCTLIMVSNATNYHAYQLSHANMINKEIMALETRKYRYISLIKDNFEFQQRKYRDEAEQRVIDCIIHDIKMNSNVITILGISIDANFMLFLRASLGTAFIAILTITFS